MDNTTEKQTTPTATETRSAPSSPAKSASQGAPRASTAPGTSRVGQYAGPYRLLETLGKGGLATVKVGVDFQSGARVAVKIVEKEKLANPREQISMAREITIMKVLKHKNVLRLHDIYENEEKIFLILDLYEGGDVYSHLTQNGSMRPSEAVHLFRQIIAGAEYCHHNMIVHRDLKPENLLLSRDKKSLVISDFGLSTGMAGSRNFLKTRCGTVHYISPEVARGDPYVGMASDVWSIGIILYAMVTATLPFDGDSSVAVLKKIVKGDYNMPSYLPSDLQDLIRKMLTLDPEQRITISQIKKHPWYKFGLEVEPEIPVTPITSVNLSLKDLVDHHDVIANLRLLGWEEGELQNELLSTNMNLAKVFFGYLIKHKAKRPESAEREAAAIPIAKISAPVTITKVSLANSSPPATSPRVSAQPASVQTEQQPAETPATPAPAETAEVVSPPRPSVAPPMSPPTRDDEISARDKITEEEESDDDGYTPSVTRERNLKSSAPGSTRRRASSIDQSDNVINSPESKNIVVRRPIATSSNSAKKSRERKPIIRRADAPTATANYRSRASTIDTPTRTPGSPNEEAASPIAGNVPIGTWLLSPSADPRAKMYSVESRKDIGQILDSLKNCFEDMQLEVVEKRSKGGMKVKARLSGGNGKKTNGIKDVVKVNIRESEDGTTSLVEIKRPGKGKKEDFHEVAKKLEETLVV